MSHLPGCPCNSAGVYATCACDQIRVSMHTEALDNNTRALQDHESLQTEVDSLRRALTEQCEAHEITQREVDSLRARLAATFAVAAFATTFAALRPESKGGA